MDNERIEKAFDDTFAGLTMYYRDCDLKQEFISKYKVNQIILELGFTDVSDFSHGLAKNLRYAIASNQAVNLALVNPDVAKFGFHLISSSAYFKVLDVYKIGHLTQILLLHINEKDVEIFKSVNSNIEEKVIKYSRESFDEKSQMPPDLILNSEEWTRRTQFPIGMSNEGLFFLDHMNK